jgi:hypothetical protein
MSIAKYPIYFDRNITERIISFMPLGKTIPTLTNANFSKLLKCAFYQIILQYGLNAFKLRTNITTSENTKNSSKDVSMQTEYLIYKWLYDHTTFKIHFPYFKNKVLDSRNSMFIMQGAMKVWVSTAKIRQIYRGDILNNRNIYNYCRAWLIYISHHKLNITLDQFNLKRKICVEIEATIQTIINWYSIQSLAKWNFINTPNQTQNQMPIDNSICNGCLLPSCPNRFCMKSIDYRLKYNKLNPFICHIFERPGSLADPEICYQFYNIIGRRLPHISTFTENEIESFAEKLKIGISFIPITKTILNWSCNGSRLERNSLGLKRSDKQYKLTDLQPCIARQIRRIPWLDAMSIY